MDEETKKRLYELRRSIGLARTNYYDRETDVARMIEWQAKLKKIIDESDIIPKLTNPNN